MADLIDEESKQWDRSKFLEAFESQTVTKVLNIHIPFKDKGNQIYWAPSTNDCFSVQKAYHLDPHRTFTIETPIHKNGWTKLWNSF